MAKEKKSTEKKPHKSTEGFQKAIQQHLDEYATTDELFAKSLQKENKTIEGCINYILDYVKKSNMIGFDDDEIFKLARHYYDEDDIKDVKPILDVEIKWNKSTAPSEEYRQEAIRKAREALFEEEKAKRIKPLKVAQSTPKEAEKEDKPQTSLF